MNPKNLRTLRFLVIALLATPFLQAQSEGESDKEQWDIKYTNGIAAVVEDRIITLEQLRKEIAPLVPQIRRRANSRYEFDQQIEVVTREVLQTLIDRVLIIEDFNEKGYQIPATYIENEFDDHITEEFNGDRAKFLEFLKIQGKNVRQFREELTEKVIVGFMRSKMIRSQSEVSPEKIEAFYQEHKYQFIEEEGVKLRVIMLEPIANESPDLMKQNADMIMGKLNEGADFAELATEFSDDDAAKDGGEWPWYGRNELKEELRTVAFSLDKGQYSEPINLEGYTYILYLEDKREEGVRELAKVRGEIENAIAARLARESQQKWLEKLRKGSYIKYFLQNS